MQKRYYILFFTICPGLVVTNGLDGELALSVLLFPGGFLMIEAVGQSFPERFGCKESAMDMVQYFVIVFGSLEEISRKGQTLIRTSIIPKGPLRMSKVLVGCRPDRIHDG